MCFLDVMLCRYQFHRVNIQSLCEYKCLRNLHILPAAFDICDRHA